LNDELTLYDATRDELRRRLSDRFPTEFDLESTLTAYAYWVCTVMDRHGKDWESAMQQYVDLALREALQEARAEKIEVDLLRQALASCASPLLDVGAGWGRFGALYAACGLNAVYTEPSSLGCHLLARSALRDSVRCLGQALSFSPGAFNSAVIGWVVHHDAPDAPAARILGEIARVTAPSGRLLSIEPLSGDFDAPKWRGLVESAGFDVETWQVFFDSAGAGKRHEQYACLTAVRRAG